MSGFESSLGASILTAESKSWSAITSGFDSVVSGFESSAKGSNSIDERELDLFKESDWDESLSDDSSSIWMGSWSDFAWIKSLSIKKSFFILEKSSLKFSNISFRIVFISWAFSPLLKKSNAEITNTEMNMKINRAPISLIS